MVSLPDSNASPGLDRPKSTDEFSRKDIAASLGAKDPSWFRQTADRGIGSGAYRRNDTDAEAAPSFTSRGMRLPGMSKDFNTSQDRSGKETEKATPPGSPLKSASTLPLDEQRRSIVEEVTPARPTSLISSSPPKTPLLDLPVFKPLDLNTSLESDSVGLGRSPSLLSSPDRPPSPTKGLGGFVQSAMMKRSDSVNKRWSVQANAGLKRGDSIATSRPTHLSGASGFSPGHSRASSRDTRTVRDGTSSPLSSSRPVSSHGMPEPVPLTKGRPISRHQDESAGSPKASAANGSDGQAKAGEFRESPAKERPSTPPLAESILSRSPSKTMDPRRWSPTKASWLESALNKPDSPRFTPAKPETPAWKLNMQRAKLEQQSQSSEAAQTTSKSVVASKPLISPPLSVTQASKPREDTANPSSEPPELSKQDLKSTISRNDPAPSQAGQLAKEKKDERPAIPSKRNVTPVQLETSSIGDQASSRQTTDSAEKPQRVSVTENKPPVLKPKPQTPPKTDFRSNLKPRQIASPGNGDGEPEFRAVFGKLKRTQTQNYVAPDLLKDNITKGKAALNTTGGPQKTKRVDDFKESILQKKEAMKSGGASRPESMTSPAKPAEPVPEALARRMTLHKTGPSSEKIELKKPFDEPEKSIATPTKSHFVPEKPLSLKKEAPAAQAIDREQPEVNPSLSMSNKEVPASREAELPTVGTNFKAKATENSKIAARLNPGLAGLLSRSGSPRLPGDSSNGGGQLPVRDTQVTSREGTNDDGSELTHMTKGRAKGPKRRAPKGSSSSKSSHETTSKPPVMSADITTPQQAPSQETTFPKPAGFSSRFSDPRAGPRMDLEENKATHSKPDLAAPLSQPIKPKSLLEGTKPIGKLNPGLSPPKPEPVQQPEPSPKPRPVVANKSAELRKVSNPAMSSKPSDSPDAVKPSTPKKFEVLTDRPKFLSSPPVSDGGQQSAAESTPPLPSNMPLTPSKSKLNTPKAPKPVVDNSTKPGSANLLGKVGGLGLQFASASTKPTSSSVLTPPPESEVSNKRVVASPRKVASPTKSTSSVQPQLESFFGALPQTNEKADFDTHAFLTAQNNAAVKTKTLSMQIWEVSGDGKRTPMPPQQEHILFEDSMYLCVHSMESLHGSKSSETYLWCGDEVPEAAVEDAQLFCRKVARDNNAKLEVVKQGKESSEFFQALGGIVITRKNKSSALYMLCGRRHLGHVAFDEVDLSASSLCSGLPFLISAKFGKLYLWKGNGSDQEDVGCARLIGMDLGLTGEIEEVTEGEEPASFWESFPSRPAKQTGPQTNNGVGKFPGQAAKLYRVEHDRPKSSGGFWGLRASSPPKQQTKAIVEEISPFCQKDLDKHHIHILDTYGEIYV